MSEPRSNAQGRLVERLPQKPPFLFVDEVISVDPQRSAVGAVVFPSGHRVFEGHLPDDPIVPGVIVIEALAQLSALTAGAGTGTGTGDGEATRGYLARVDRMRFRRLVRPGERLVLRSRLVRRFGSAAEFDVDADVGGDEVAAGSITIAGMR